MEAPAGPPATRSMGCDTAVKGPRVDPSGLVIVGTAVIVTPVGSGVGSGLAGLTVITRPVLSSATTMPGSLEVTLVPTLAPAAGAVGSPTESTKLIVAVAVPLSSNWKSPIAADLLAFYASIFAPSLRLIWAPAITFVAGCSLRIAKIC